MWSLKIGKHNDSKIINKIKFKKIEAQKNMKNFIQNNFMNKPFSEQQETNISEENYCKTWKNNDTDNLPITCNPVDKRELFFFQIIKNNQWQNQIL